MSDEKLQNYAVELANEALWDYEFISVTENYEELTDDECIRVHDLITKKVKAHIPTVPQVIRTQEELEALDPDTLVGTHREIVSTTFGAGHILATDYLDDLMFPMVVVSTGDQVRAAREAMEVINE